MTVKELNKYYKLLYKTVAKIAKFSEKNNEDYPGCLRIFADYLLETADLNEEIDLEELYEEEELEEDD